ncbi:hypothetical protein EV363DRAFT_46946 [Boletus edulis]|nr:hypothetical protein EV363DRAFT_46946 [Boletus edulis]
MNLVCWYGCAQEPCSCVQSCMHTLVYDIKKRSKHPQISCQSECPSHIDTNKTKDYLVWRHREPSSNVTYLAGQTCSLSFPSNGWVQIEYFEYFGVPASQSLKSGRSKIFMTRHDVIDSPSRRTPMLDLLHHKHGKFHVAASIVIVVVSRDQPLSVVKHTLEAKHDLPSDESSEVARFLSSSRSSFGGGCSRSPTPALGKARMWHDALQRKRSGANMMLAAQKVI